MNGLYTAEHVERPALIKSMKPLGFTAQQMRELLDVRDTLADTDPADDARDNARGRLRQFAALAATAREKLRGQLAGGDEFGQQLRRESRRPRITATRN